MSQLRFIFGRTKDAEAARELCEAELGDSWHVRVMPGWLPYNPYALEPISWKSNKQLTVVLAFHDRLAVVEDAMFPLNAINVRLGKSYSPARQSSWTLTTIDSYRIDIRKEMAHVLFESEAAAEEAMAALNGKSLREGGPPLEFLEPLESVPSVAPTGMLILRNNSLRVTGLGPRTTNGRLKAFLKGAPGFISCSLRKLESLCHFHRYLYISSYIGTHWSGVSLGYGVVFFKSDDTAQAAMDHFQAKIYPDSGNPVNIQYMLRRPEQNMYLEIAERQG